MSRLVIPLLLLLLFAPMVSAVYSVELNGFLYLISYKVYSNGTVALINAEIDNMGNTCDMAGNCWQEVYEVYDYLLYYNGSALYLLNFTPALKKSLPSYASKNITYVYFNWVYYANGSWYVNVSVSTYSPETDESFNRDYVYRLNLKNFCVEQTNITFRAIPVMAINGTINGWKIVVPSEFLPSPDYGPFKAYIFVSVNSSITKPENCCSVLAIPSYSKLPVYFLLEKDGQVKNVTLFYINATENLTGFWFPGSVKIVNVTFCKPIVAPENATSNGTATQTSAQKNTTIHTTNEAPNTTAPTSAKTRKNICGPGLIGLLALAPLLFRKR
ncbi:hypothetical protein [Thermococcus sp.]|uniref:hypothetical protein n=1 Tax=Thermococcus sp. TaxID=35749 RepID=UPI002618B842|nr:hypothetical protein [Thermococcus sp.]